MFERNPPVNVASQVRNGGVAEIGRIHALGQQCESVEKVQILGVVIESEYRLYFAATNAEPGFEPIVGECPVERRMPLAQVAQVAIVDLRPHTKSVGDLAGDVCSEVRERAATLAGMHGQPVVLVAIYESLRGEAVDLNLAVKKPEFLRAQQSRTCAQAHKSQWNDSSTHTRSSEMV